MDNIRGPHYGKPPRRPPRPKMPNLQAALASIPDSGVTDRPLDFSVSVKNKTSLPLRLIKSLGFVSKKDKGIREKLSILDSAYKSEKATDYLLALQNMIKIPQVKKIIENNPKLVKQFNQLEDKAMIDYLRKVNDATKINPNFNIESIIKKLNNNPRIHRNAEIRKMYENFVIYRANMIISGSLRVCCLIRNIERN